MMTDSERLARMERRLETLISAMSALADTMTVNNAMLAEIMAWLQKPPSSDLVDTLRGLAAEIAEMRKDIAALPASVARAVTDGEA